MLPSLLLTLALLGPAEPIKRASHPALSPDGATMVFSYQGDLWFVAASGGRAMRLTVHPATEQMPRYSPDGRTLVFASNRYGSTDVFAMDPDGGNIRRLTFDSASESPTSFSPDGKYVYGHTNAWGRMDAFRVPLEGGELLRLTGHPMEAESQPVPSPDGARMLYITGGYPGSWRAPHHHGSSAAQIWSAKAGVPLTGHRNLTSDDSNNLFPTFSPDGLLYFVSNRSGWPNVWRAGGDGRDPKQVTRHQNGTLRYLTIAANAPVAAYEFDSVIYRLDLRSGRSEPVQIMVPADQRNNPVLDWSQSTGLSGFAVAPGGKRTVTEVRGDLFLIPERGGATKRLTASPSNDTQPVWLTPRLVLFATGRNGKRELMTVGVDGVERPFAADDLDLANPRLSPDGQWIALHRGLDQIAVLPANGGELKTLITGNFGDGLTGYPSFTWSPDSKWLAVDVPNDRGSTVTLVPIGGGRAIPIAWTARGVYGPPQFTPNGRGVYFCARENEDPELFIVDLWPPSVTFQEDDLDKIDGKMEDTSATTEVRVFEPGIQFRMRRLTTKPTIGAWASPDGRLIYANVDGQFSALPVGGGSIAAVPGVQGTASNVLFTSGGQSMYVSSGGRLLAVAPQTGQATPVAFTATGRIDRKAEESALFDEICWAMDRMYYNEPYIRSRWPALKERFGRLVPHAFDRDDFYNLMDEMMEELDSSHVGASAPRTAAPQATEDTGFLGIELDWRALAARGEYLVADVLAQSPAEHPDSALKPGDRLVAIDGQKLGNDLTIAQALNGKVGKKLKLDLVRGGVQTSVYIKPGSGRDKSNSLYEDWVLEMRSKTEQLGGGKLTYLHIEGMDPSSHALFLRQIRTLTAGKAGAVIDVRYNGGGSTAQQALNVLIKSPWLIRTSRNAPGMKVSENIWRGDSLELPSVLLINQASFSNAEIFAEGFRRLGIGPIVGVATAGGVIGTSSYGLWDGGSIRVPGSGAYAVDGENLEGQGRKPDVRVPWEPDAWSVGRDVQLETAVRELMKRIRS
jgi:tricorn protease